MDSPAVQMTPDTFTKECLLGIDPAMLSDLRQLTFRQFWTDCQNVEILSKRSLAEQNQAVTLSFSYVTKFGLPVNDIVIQSAGKAYRKLNASHRQEDEGSKLEL